jgi:hypothetical protein
VTGQVRDVAIGSDLPPAYGEHLIIKHYREQKLSRIAITSVHGRRAQSDEAVLFSRAGTREFAKACSMPATQSVPDPRTMTALPRR